MSDIQSVRERLDRAAKDNNSHWSMTAGSDLCVDVRVSDLEALLADHARLQNEVSGVSQQWRPMTPDMEHVGPAWCAVRVFGGVVFLRWDVHYVEIDETGQIASDFHQGWEIEDYEFWMPVAPPEPPFDGGEAVHSQAEGGEV